MPMWNIWRRSVRYQKYKEGISNKQMKKISFILYFMVVVTLLSGCMVMDKPDQKAVDDFSKALKEATGSVYFYFDGRKNGFDGAIIYNFEIQRFDASAIGKLIEAANNAIPNDGTKIGIYVFFDTSAGIYPNMFFAGNYLDDGTMLDGIEYIRILDQTNFSYTACDPMFYSEIKGIKALEVDRGIDKYFDNAGTIWYTYWPELENIKYNYRINFKTDEELSSSVIDSCNKDLANAVSHNTTITVEVRDGSGYDIFNVSNYPATDKSHEGSCILTILDRTDQASNVKGVLLDPSLYSQIDGVKELYVSEEVQKYAEDAGINWYTYWPDLEKTEVLNKNIR